MLDGPIVEEVDYEKEPKEKPKKRKKSRFELS